MLRRRGGCSDSEATIRTFVTRLRPWNRRGGRLGHSRAAKRSAVTDLRDENRRGPTVGLTGVHVFQVPSRRSTTAPSRASALAGNAIEPTETRGEPTSVRVAARESTAASLRRFRIALTIREALTPQAYGRPVWEFATSNGGGRRRGGGRGTPGGRPRARGWATNMPPTPRLGTRGPRARSARRCGLRPGCAAVVPRAQRRTPTRSSSLTSTTSPSRPRNNCCGCLVSPGSGVGNRASSPATPAARTHAAGLARRRGLIHATDGCQGDRIVP